MFKLTESKISRDADGPLKRILGERRRIEDLQTRKALDFYFDGAEWREPDVVGDFSFNRCPDGLDARPGLEGGMGRNSSFFQIGDCIMFEIQEFWDIESFNIEAWDNY